MVKEFKSGDVTMRVQYIPNRRHKDLFEFEIDDTVAGVIYRYELEELLREEETSTANVNEGGDYLSS